MRCAPAWLLVLTCLAHAGSVQTQDGKTYVGKIVTAQGTLIVQPEGGGEEVRLPQESLRHVSFRWASSLQQLSPAQDGKLPSPWRSEDIGKVSRPGEAMPGADRRLTVRASGWGVWGLADVLHLVYCPLQGNGEITARITSVDASRGAFAVGLMLRESAAPESAMATLWFQGGRLRTGGRAAGTPSETRDGPEAKAGIWLRLARQGNIFAAYQSADGKQWEQFDSRRVPMGAQAIAGVAAWSMSNTSLGEATVQAVSVRAGTSANAAAGLEQGVVLRDGSVWNGKIQGSDDEKLTLLRGSKPLVIEKKKIAAIILAPLPMAFEKLVEQPGVLLSSGDYIEGTPGGLTLVGTSAGRTGKITVTSLVAGIVEVDAGSAVAVILAKPAGEATRGYRVRLDDGSVLQAATVSLTDAGVVVDGTEMKDVAEIEGRQTSGR